MGELEQEFIKWALFGVLGLAVWFLKNLVTRTDKELKDLSQEISAIKMQYLHKDDFKDFKNELRIMFDEIKADLRDIKSNRTL
jgi:hypothetical protein